jgi:hypothetical protein
MNSPTSNAVADLAPRAIDLLLSRLESDVGDVDDEWEQREDVVAGEVTGESTWQWSVARNIERAIRVIKALRLANETSVIQWVPIGERRPVDMATVLVHSAHMQSRVGTDSAFLVRKLWACAKQDAEECYYSHWAPLPGPPSLTPTTRAPQFCCFEDCDGDPTDGPYCAAHAAQERAEKTGDGR